MRLAGQGRKCQQDSQVSVRELFESFESVSYSLLKFGNRSLNSLSPLPLFASCMELGAPDVDQGEPPSL